MLQHGVLSFALLGAEWVLWVLVALSFGIVAVSIERAFFLLRDSVDRGKLGRTVNAFLAGGDVAAFKGELAGMRGFEARVLAAGADAAGLGAEAAEKAMHGTMTAERLRMERGLVYLATVGSNAPFVGLFGTVLGIMRAFHDLSLKSADAMEAVMAGIAEALVATAVGLFVAIPAVVLYNLFSRWVRGRMSRSDSLADLVVARLRGGTSGATHG